MGAGPEQRAIALADDLAVALAPTGWVMDPIHTVLDRGNVTAVRMTEADFTYALHLSCLDFLELVKAGWYTECHYDWEVIVSLDAFEALVQHVEREV